MDIPEEIKHICKLTHNSDSISGFSDYNYQLYYRTIIITYVQIYDENHSTIRAE
jgi:spore coat protein CotH